MTGIHNAKVSGLSNPPSGAIGGADWDAALRGNADTALRVVASNASAKSIAAADYLCDGTADDVQINAALAVGRPVVLSEGDFYCASTVNADAGTLIGAGNWNPEQPYGPSSTLIAVTAGMNVVAASAQSRLMDFAIQGANLADYGVQFTSARPFAANLAVMRCRKSSYLFAQTQNGCYINLYSHFSACGFLLGNGARNNNFYNATSEVYEGIYSYSGTAFVDTAAIRFVVDEADTELGTGIWTNGNDRNNFFGGIHERCGSAIVFENRSGFTGAQATNNQFYGVEFTTAYAGPILRSTSGNPGWLYFNACSFGAGLDQAQPWGVGTLGQVYFDGNCYFSGGNDVAKRGVTQDSNYVELFYIDTDKVKANYVDNAGTTTYTAATRTYSHTGGNDILGVAFRSAAQPSNTTSDVTVTQGGGFLARVSFVLTIVGANPVLVYIPLNGSPWRRLIQSATAGTYSFLVRFGEDALDQFQVEFAVNGNTSFVVRSLSVKPV